MEDHEKPLTRAQAWARRIQSQAFPIDVIAAEAIALADALDADHDAAHADAIAQLHADLDLLAQENKQLRKELAEAQDGADKPARKQKGKDE